MNYPDLLDEYSKRRSGKSKQAEQRIRSLCDSNSFVELNMFTAPGQGSAVCCGFARINDRPVFIYGFNHEVNCGAVSQKSANAVTALFEKACTTGTPIVGILHSDGALLSGALDTADGYGKMIKAAAKASGIVPHIVLVEGPALGAMAMFAQCADVVILDKKACIGIGTAGDSMISSEQAAAAGTVSMLTENEQQANGVIRQILSYLPDNNLSQPENLPTNDDINRKCEGLDSDNIDVKKVIDIVFDIDSFFELYRDFGPDMMCGFASIDGVSVGVIANSEPLISDSGSQKSARMAEMCNAYSLPLIVLCNAEGFKSADCESRGVLKSDAKLAMSLASADVPMITVILGMAVGGAFIAMGSKSIGADIVYAWVGAKVGLMSAEAAVAVLEGQKLSECDDPIKGRAELIEKYETEEMNVYKAAENGYIDQPILPEDTRAYIGAALDCMYNKKQLLPYRKNRVLPL